jgi:hypothetical protein
MFGFANIGHWFASIGRDIVNGVVKIDPVVKSSEIPVETATGLIPGIGAPAVLLERAIYGIWGKVSQAVHDGQQLAVAGKPLLDPTEIAEIEAIIAAIKALPSAVKIPAPATPSAPASLTAPAPVAATVHPAVK